MKNSKPVLDPELANMKGPEAKTAMLILLTACTCNVAADRSASMENQRFHNGLL